jgi:LPXTG-motif cell wall-anchored protein
MPPQGGNRLAGESRSKALYVVSLWRIRLRQPTDVEAVEVILSRHPQEPSSSRHRACAGAFGKLLTGLSMVAVLVTATSGVSGASTGVPPTITATVASFVIPQGATAPPIGTTWMLKLQDLTSTKILGTTTFTTTAAQPTSTLEIPVPTVAGCNFQADVRTTPPGVPVDAKSGTFYSDLIAVVPGCGTTPPVITPTTTTTTTTTTAVPPPATKPPTPPTVAASSVLPFTDADGTAATTDAATSELPFTGADYPLLAALGLLLVGLGALLMRRRELKLHSIGRFAESDSDQ